MSALLSNLVSCVGSDYVLSREDDMAPYMNDWRGRYRGRAQAVVRPEDTASLAAVVRVCHQAGAPIVPQGGNTGLCGGATPLEDGQAVVVSLGRMKAIRAIDTDNNTLCAEAGCTLYDLQQAAREVDRLFPLSLASEGSCQIGGNLSTNAGGVHVLRYGNMRELTLGLEVVLPDGQIWNGLRGLRKDNTGYDLKHLFIGAEGTLGIITAAVLKLFPLPRAMATACVAVPDPAAAVALLARLRFVCGDRVSSFELIGRPALELVLQHMPDRRDPFESASSWAVLIELSDTLEGEQLDVLLETQLAEAIESGLVDDAILARSIEQRQRLWALREDISEAQRIEGVSIKHDISVPVSAIPEFLRRADKALIHHWPDVRIVAFGHIGDGNLHYNLSKAATEENAAFIARTEAVNRIVHDLVNELGGSISAEHGLGQLKCGEILRYKSPLEISLMRCIKDALDPAGLMNPGKLFQQ